MKKLDSRTLIELILLVVAVIFWVLRKANVLYIPGLAAIALAIAMGLLGMGYIAQKQKSRKLAGVLLLAFALLQIIVGLMEIRSFAARERIDTEKPRHQPWLFACRRACVARDRATRAAFAAIR